MALQLRSVNGESGPFLRFPPRGVRIPRAGSRRLFPFRTVRFIHWTVDGALAFYWDSVAGFLDPQPDCSTDPECDDGQFCNGAEICSGGTCQAGTDPCPGQGCDEGSDSCVTCGGNKAACDTGADCCSGNCRKGSCRGN